MMVYAFTRVRSLWGSSQWQVFGFLSIGLAMCWAMYQDTRPS
ncbi:MAG: hypothetical protein U0905_08710 [Pirellulales bacterium]